MNFLIVLVIVSVIVVDNSKVNSVSRRKNKALNLQLQSIRQMVNQTQADRLNLPANATSIRENIVDTFSCASRDYGYYADVDNDCQIFHVCFPTQGRRRNSSMRWSFICPNDTIFNQEVLVCTRPRDSIDCQDAPAFYDVNLKFGAVNKTKNVEKNAISQNRKSKSYLRQNIVVRNFKKGL